MIMVGDNEDDNSWADARDLSDTEPDSSQTDVDVTRSSEPGEPGEPDAARGDQTVVDIPEERMGTVEADDRSTAGEDDANDSDELPEIDTLISAHPGARTSQEGSGSIDPDEEMFARGRELFSRYDCEDFSELISPTRIAAPVPSTPQSRRITRKREEISPDGVVHFESVERPVKSTDEDFQRMFKLLQASNRKDKKRKTKITKAHLTETLRMVNNDDLDDDFQDEEADKMDPETEKALRVSSSSSSSPCCLPIHFSSPHSFSLFFFL